MRNAGGFDDEGDGVDGVEMGRVLGNFFQIGLLYVKQMTLQVSLQ